MTISTSYSVLSFAGNDATTEFAVSWQFFEDTTLVVILKASDGTRTTQTITTHYTVAGGSDDNDGAPSTGTVTMLTAPASGETLLIKRTTAKTQSLDLTNVGSFDSDNVEYAMDRLLLIIQELAVDETPYIGDYAVSDLPAAGSEGRWAYATDGRKNGESAGSGSGVMAFDDGSAWRACDTGATVAA